MGWMNGMVSNITADAGRVGKTIADAVVKAIVASVRMIESFAVGSVKALSVAIGVATAAVTLAIHKITTVTAQLGRDINSLRSTTGLNAMTAGAVQNRFGAFGLNASTTTGNQGPGMFAMKAGVYGLPGYQDSRFIERAAGRYQQLQGQGIVGQSMARNLAGSVGMDSPDALRTLMLPLAKIREQQSFSTGVQGALGLDSGALAEAAQNWELLQNKVALVSKFIVAKLGTEMMPRLTQGLDMVVNLVANNADKIGTFIVDGVSVAIDAASSFGRFLFTTLPPIFFDVSRAILQGLAGVSDAAPMVWDGFLNALSRLQPFLEDLGARVTTFFDAIATGLNNIEQSDLYKAAKGALNVVQTVHNATAPIGNAAKRAASGLGADENTSSLAKVGTQLGIGAALMWGAKQLPGMAMRGLGLGAGGLGAGTGAGLPASFVPSGVPGGAASRFAASPAGRLMTNPVTGRLALGVAAGYGLYKGGQSMGLIDRDQSFTDRMATGWGRLRDAATGNSGHYDRMVNAQWAADRNAANAPTLGQRAGNAASGAQAAFSGLFAPTARTSWANGLDNSMGGALRDGAAGVGGAARRGIATIDKQEAAYQQSVNRLDAILNELRGQSGDLKGIRQEAGKTNSNDAARVALAKCVGQDTGIEGFLVNTRR